VPPVELQLLPTQTQQLASTHPSHRLKAATCLLSLPAVHQEGAGAFPLQFIKKAQAHSQYAAATAAAGQLICHTRFGSSGINASSVAAQQQ